MPRGTWICTYVGKVLDGREAHEAVEAGKTAYLMRLGKGISIDAFAEDSCLARFINHSQNASNARFVKEPKLLRARVVATRDLQAGEEVLVNYGRHYWTVLGLVPKDSE